jgi:hypothetical protein
MSASVFVDGSKTSGSTVVDAMLCAFCIESTTTHEIWVGAAGPLEFPPVICAWQVHTATEAITNRHSPFVSIVDLLIKLSRLHSEGHKKTG